MNMCALRKVWMGVLAALLVVSCNKDNSASKSQKVAVLLPDASVIDRWSTDRKNLETVMGKYGFNASFYTAPETAEGAAMQVEQLKKVIGEGAGYVVLTAIDYKKINESKLLEQHPNVKVVCHDRLLVDNPRIAYISSADTKEIGRMQAMTIDKNLTEMAYNTALIINSLVAGSPVLSSESIFVGSVNIPVFYSKNTLVTIDSL